MATLLFFIVFVLFLIVFMAATEVVALELLHAEGFVCVPSETLLFFSVFMAAMIRDVLRG